MAKPRRRYSANLPRMRVVWSPHAIDRVVEIATYIAQNSPAAARDWVERLFAHVDSSRSGAAASSSTQMSCGKVQHNKRYQ